MKTLRAPDVVRSDDVALCVAARQVISPAAVIRCSRLRRARNDEEGGMLAVSARLSYAVAMSKQIAAIVCLVLLGLSLGGCTKCGWLWDQPPRSCHSVAPRI
jgi:hypothetical protein